MHKTPETILALDPGLRDLGYAVIAGRKLVTAGVLPLRAIPSGQRLATVGVSLESWIRGYRPTSLVVEHIPKRPLDSIAGLPALGRLIERLGRRRRLRLATYSARTVRRTVVGNGWAGKRDAARSLSRRYPQLRVCLTQDRKWKEAYWQNMFDAVALAVHHQVGIQPPSRSRFSD